MRLYIMRHGIAYEHDEWKGRDFTRPLTPEGKKRTRHVLESLHAEKKLAVDTLWSSPLTRAHETAEIAAEILGLKVEIVDALACGASLSTVSRFISGLAAAPERLMWVGHEPDCGHIIGQLSGDPGGDFALKKAGIARLDGEFTGGGMQLKWLLTPKDVLQDDRRDAHIGERP